MSDDLAQRASTTCSCIPNVGPFIVEAADPEARHRQSVAAATWRASPAVFNDNGAGVRGDLKAVVRAILLDPEARGAAKLDPGYGKLREPAQFVAGAARALDAHDRRRVLPRADRRDGPAGLHRAVGVQLLPARLRRSRHHRARARVRDPEHDAPRWPASNFVNTLAFAAAIAPDPTVFGATGTQLDWTPRAGAGRRSRGAGRPARPAADARHAVGRGEGRDRDRGHRGSRDRSADAGEDRVLPRRSPRRNTRWSADDDHGPSPPPRLRAAAPARSAARLALGVAPRLLDLICSLTAHAQTAPADYKALVCVFLFGGNDGNNLLVPPTPPATRNTPPCAARARASQITQSRAPADPAERISARRSACIPR